MGNAHRGDHDIAFYEATVGHTFQGAGTTAPSFVNSDGDGPLPPARYLIQLADTSAESVICWVGFEGFEEGATASSIAGAGPKRIPLKRDTIVAIETNILEGEDDRMILETSAGTATVYVTRVSTVVQKGVRG